ncbi:MAG: fumarylacetoacetate hydrolase family protein [Burkholderiaceae bacterium]
MTLPWLTFGTVYGTLLNFRAERDALGARMDEPPYKGAPRAPVLYVKTANTWTPSGRRVPLPTIPAHVAQVQVGATLGLVMTAANQVGGVVPMLDLSIPHDGTSGGYYRPPVKYRNLDGFLGVGVMQPGALDSFDWDALSLELRIDGELRQTVRWGASALVRDAATLVRDVSDFMTLRSGDVLMLGLPPQPPLAHAGQRIELTAQGFAPLSVSLVTESAEAAA